MIVGIVVLAWMGLLLVTPVSMLPFGKMNMVSDADSGDAYKVTFLLSRPVDFSDFRNAIPVVDGWRRFNATGSLAQTEYLKPKAQVLWVYTQPDKAVHVTLVLSDILGTIHIPEVCYKAQGFTVLSSDVARVVVPVPLTNRTVHFYATKLWTQRQLGNGSTETRQVVYWLLRQGAGLAGRDAYFVRVECLNQPREEAERTAVEFSRLIFSSILNPGGTRLGSGVGPTVGESVIARYGIGGVVVCVALFAAPAAFLFWILPGLGGNRPGNPPRGWFG